ncbi:MAG: 50S ribosomal protein L3 [Candidatus Vogelbacteria bacterium CG10_big_fil_rev_8_21_14_0_10_45_14]|uniref:Large ribosomal subunit protein uL3 n=1 Tax=Candidatus Vogelbacteria bacterium CG10_big_fil_rev_8_21_14_0_10_45_14 TaxID=1975042 RepID=A0A2H0RJJ4_9BACT|nr:MAG: 50S ribosomal protein L3 [Candidatus Vogelbacteria bacterium CG10_big_fil_rev_8_21_14_0_10_45_14]
MKFFVGKKLGMTQVFHEDGACTPATLVAVPKITITALKTMEKDGYKAVQVAGGTRKEKNLNKSMLGHFKSKAYSYSREFRLKNDSDDKDAEKLNVGDELSVDVFAKGDILQISGISKGKGFQGVIKRHGFHGGPRSHGQKHSERAPGSIGGGLRNRVPKGMKMAGRMGSDTITVKGIEVVSVDVAKEEILLKGALPGRKGTLISMKTV